MKEECVAVEGSRYEMRDGAERWETRKMEAQKLHREMYKGNITRRSADLGCGGDGARLTDCWMRKRRKLLGLEGVWRVSGGGTR